MSLYESAVSSLYRTNIYQPVKMGLTNMQMLHRFLGYPMNHVPAVHVAGTNGKGSVAFKIAKALESSGYRSALFVSPHISTFRERMQVNGDVIPEDAVVKYTDRIFSICKENRISATFFELTTAMAFAFFKESRADIAVVETGLGGRLDATNVITPILSVITSIGLEHTAILGDTIEKVAYEKGGIIKPHVPVLIGEHCPSGQLEEIAKSRCSPFCKVSDIVDAPQPATSHSAHMDYDVENSLIASAALRMLSKTTQFSNLSVENIVKGISRRPPCRFEIIEIPAASRKRKVTIVLDVAHNPPAIERMKEKLVLEFPRRTYRFVVGFCRDKNFAECLNTLSSLVGKGQRGRIHLVRAAHPRAAEVELLEKELRRLMPESIRSSGEKEESVGNAVRRAMHEASQSDEDEVVVICGSVFIMSEAREAIGMEEPKVSVLPTTSVPISEGYCFELPLAQDSKILSQLFGSNYSYSQDILPTRV